MTETSQDSSALLAELPALAQDDRVARVRDAGPPEEVLQQLAAEAEQLAVADAGRALAATDCLISLAETFATPLGRSVVLRAT